MRRLSWYLIVLAATTVLSGCYYNPGYSYVRGSSDRGDAYYGQQRTTVYDNGYYAAPVYGGGGYYGYGGYGGYVVPGVTLGVTGGWYGAPRYRAYGYPAYRTGPGAWSGRNGWHERGPAYRGVPHRMSQPDPRHDGRYDRRYDRRH